MTWTTALLRAFLSKHVLQPMHVFMLQNRLQ